MKEKDEIAELFRDQLANHSEQVNPALWAKIQTGIATKGASAVIGASKLISIVKTISIVGGLVAAVAVTTILVKDSGKEKINTVIKTETAPYLNEAENTLPLEIGPKLENSQFEVSKPSHQSPSTKITADNNSASTTIENTEQADKEAVGDYKKPIESNQPSDENTSKPIITNNKSTPEAIGSENASPQASFSGSNPEPSRNNEKFNPKDLLSSPIPNIFTPNGDGQNDLFQIPLSAQANHKTQIFNQKGQLIAEFDSKSEGWNGISRGGQEALEGTYFYVTFVSEGSGKNGAIKGTITLRR
ncbi:MAG: gliding motility-associated C-terminal domain-containing protein [Bacteroidota bacterium]